MRKLKRFNLARAVMLLLFTVLATSMARAVNVSYIDENGQTQSHDCTPLSEDYLNKHRQNREDIIDGGWYVVNSTFTVDDFNCTRIRIKGDVKIILQDGCAMMTCMAINVSGDNSLTIYGQAGNTGKLQSGSALIGTEYKYCYDTDAGIGSGLEETCGTIKIHGGRIIARGGSYKQISNFEFSNSGCGIGCGHKGSGGTIVITGGDILASGYKWCAGIGGNWSNITITGGIINATGGLNNGDGVAGSGAGIGGSRAGGATITITGGTIRATGGNKAAAIGSGYDGSAASTVKISGGQITTLHTYQGVSIGGDGSTIELGWTKPTDFINNSGGYKGSVTLKKQFHCNGTIFNAGSVSDNSTIGGKELIPLTLSGSGTSTNPYLIESSETWKTFCLYLQDNNTWNGFSNKYVKLTNDIAVSTMAGDDNHKFAGIFLGNKHKLTFDYNGGDDVVAPFRQTNGATFKDLWVAGTITTSNKHAAGLIGSSYGTTTIENCRSSVTINSSVSNSANNDGTHAGFISTTSGQVTFTGCLFDGRIASANTSSKTSCCAGFIGWNNNTNNTVNITNSMISADMSTIDANDSYTFVRRGGNTTVTNSYYTAALGTTQGQKAYRIKAGNGVTLSHYGNGTAYDVSGITAYSPGILYNDNLYAGSAEKVQLTLDYAPVPTGKVLTISAGAGTVTGSGNPYTLTMPAEDVTVSVAYHASPLLGFSDTYDPDGSENKPYIINSTAGWNFFCSALENADVWNHFSGKYVKLGGNITAQQMAGTADHKFAGIFDGDNKKLTFNMTAETDGCAPFRYVNGATIKRLTVEGTVSNSGKELGGLIAYAYGTNTIDHCVVASSLTSTYEGEASNGGFIAHVCSGTTNFTYCAFMGSLLGSTATHSAGFVGDAINTQLNFTNCLFYPKTITMDSKNSATFRRNGGYNLHKCSFYTESFGTTQGTQVYALEPDVFTKKVQLFDGNSKTYYAQYYSYINNVNSSYEYTGEVIPVTPTVNFDSANLSSTDDYTFTFTPSPVKEPGKYTVTVTGKGNYTGRITKEFKVNRVLFKDNSGAYVIENDDDWVIFCKNISEGTMYYEGKTVKLMNDINASVIFSDASSAFKGTFEGNHKKITFNHESGSDYAAPFRCINGATIKDLTVVGVLDAKWGKYVGGLVGKNFGNSQIINCTSSVAIKGENSTVTHEGYYGGFVGENTNNATLAFDRCTFNGSMTCEGGRKSDAGFVAINRNKSANVTISYTDCLFNPSSLNIDKTDCATFNRDGHNSLTDSYYTMPFGENQGIMAYADVPDVDICKTIEVNGFTLYKGVEHEITGISDTYDYGGTPVVVSPTAVTIEGQPVALGNSGYTFVVIDAEGNDVTSGITETGNYSIVVTAHGNYYGSKSIPFQVLGQLAGKGTSGSPFLIANAAQWQTFATNISMGQHQDAYYKLTGSFETNVMIGDADHKFSGHLDGDKKTLTFNYEATDDNAAPFAYLSSADIHDLNVTGNITTAYTCAAGIASHNEGETTISRCISTVTITGNSTTSKEYHNGGFVGENVAGATLSFADCAFKGSILGNGYAVGGFVGVNEEARNNPSVLNLTNCLSAPVEMQPGNSYSGVFCYVSIWKDYSIINVSECYFVNSFRYTEHGAHVEADIPENKAYKIVNAPDGNTYYAPFVVTNVPLMVPANGGDPVVLEPVVKLGAADVPTANYTLTFKDTNNEVVLPENLTQDGDYTLTITGVGDGYAGSETISFAIKAGVSLDGYVFASEGEGDSIVYLIFNEDDLERLATYVNTDHNTQGKTFKLARSFTMTKEHTVIGDRYQREFMGTFDGADNTITGLTVNQPNADDRGMFGCIRNGAVIKNLTLDKCSITGKSNVGGIVGRSYTYNKINNVIQNCHVNGTIAATVSGAENHGGIIGQIRCADVIGCTMSGTVSTTVSNDYYGGIVGNARQCGTAQVTSCENAADIVGPGKYHAGIVGYHWQTNGVSVAKCFSSGSVDTSYSGKGAIAGIMDGWNYFTDCYYIGPSDLKAYGGSDSSGHAERVYSVSVSDNITNLAMTKAPTYTSVLTGDKYYKAGEWELTLTPTEGTSFVLLSCEGGTLSSATEATGNTLTITDADVTITAEVSSNSGVDMSTVTIAPIPDQRWKGTFAVEPELSVTKGKKELVRGTDYLLTFSNNTSVGKEATATLTGINGYKGTISATFSIVDFPLKNPDAANSADNPYQIATEADLQALAYIVNSGARSNGHYLQTDPIKLTKEHTPIGTSSHNFRGHYDGGNKVITGLTIDKPESTHQGLFGMVDNENNGPNALIENVIISGCNIKGATNVGAVAGLASDATIKNCFVINGHIEGTSYVGAVCGYGVWASFQNSYYADCNVNGLGDSRSSKGEDSPKKVRRVAKISAGEGVVLTLPTTPAYVFNNTNYYASGTSVTLDFMLPKDKYFSNYSVSSGTISRAGDMTGQHTLEGFTGDVVITGQYVDEPLDITNTATIADIAAQTYNGQQQRPLPVVNIDDVTLTKDVHYTVSYGADCTNVGTDHTITVTGIGGYKGTVTKNFSIVALGINSSDVTVTIPTLNYMDEALTVTPVVKYGDNTLTQGEEADYTFVTDPTTVQAAGDYTMTLTGHGNFTGTRDVNFRVDYAIPTSLIRSAQTETTATLTWTEVGPATNWTLQFSTDNTFATSETVNVSTTPTVTLEGLTTENVYYARVKAVYGENLESGWSTVCSFVPTDKWVIGSGTELSSDKLPFHNWYKNSLTQQIYTAEEMGKQAASVLSIAFYKEGTTKAERNLDVYMVNTSKSDFSDNDDWISVTAADKVFSGVVNFPDDAWGTITLDTPFAYDGTSNLAIIIDDNTGSYVGSANFRTYPTQSSLSIYVYSDNTFYDPFTPHYYSGHCDTQKNQIRMQLNPLTVVKMNDKGIMTYAGTAGLDFSKVSDLKAYVATDINGSNLTFTAVDEASAGTGLMLKGTPDATYLIPEKEDAAQPASNYLVGLTVATDVYQTTDDGLAFILANGEHGINWYRLAEEHYVLKAHSAYLRLPSNKLPAARGITMTFDDSTTEVGGMRNENREMRNDAWYTVDGVKLSGKPTRKGLYIFNGKKVVIR